MNIKKTEACSVYTCMFVFNYLSYFVLINEIELKSNIFYHVIKKLLLLINLKNII